MGDFVSSNIYMLLLCMWQTLSWYTTVTTSHVLYNIIIMNNIIFVIIVIYLFR